MSAGGRHPLRRGPGNPRVWWSGVAMAVVGAAVAVLVQWIGQATSPTTTTRAVVSVADVDPATGGRDAPDYMGVVVAVVALGFGVRGWSRRTATVPVLCAAAGLLVFGSAIQPRADLGPSRFPPPDAMSLYADPPTWPRASPLTVDGVERVVPIGTPVPGASPDVLVTGPPLPRLPEGADRARTDGFATLRIPLRTGPGAGPPTLRLIGVGIGRTLELPGCFGAPSGFSGRSESPREGFVCFAVPDGFVPGYLIVVDVAVDLRQ